MARVAALKLLSPRLPLSAPYYSEMLQPLAPIFYLPRFEEQVLSTSRLRTCSEAIAPCIVSALYPLEDICELGGQPQ